MGAQTVRMPPKKKPKASGSNKDAGKAGDAESYRKPFKPARIRRVLADAAEDRAEELAQDFTQYVNDAVRMRLEAEGKWPPKAKGSAG